MQTKVPNISVPPRTTAEALEREAYAAALHKLHVREWRRRMPVWTRRHFWLAVWRYARSLTPYDVDQVEYDNAFPSDLTSK